MYRLFSAQLAMYLTLYTILEMKIVTKILILFLTLNLFSFKGTAQETEIKKITTEFDFSTVEKFRETKLKDQIINDYDSIFSSFHPIQIFENMQLT